MISMKPRSFYLLLSVFFLNVSFLFGQSTSIKSASGNGPVLNGLKITDAKAVGNLEEFGTSTLHPTTGSGEADVRFSLSGKITQYRYNGKTYKTEYPDCGIACFDCSGKKVKVTATVKYANKTITRFGEATAFAGVHHLVIKFPDMVKRNTVSLVKLVVEPVAYPRFEAQLSKLKKCEEEQEKKKKEKEKKEIPAVDEDWWNGKDEKPEKRKIVLNGSDADWWNGKDSKEEKPVNKNIPDADWWNGKNEKADADKKQQNAFRVVNNYSNYNSNNEGKYSWVEDADGNIIIPKGKYYIASFEDGLAQVEILIRTDYYDFVFHKKVQLFEHCFMDENGNKLPPKTYHVSFWHYYTPPVLWDAAMSRAEIEETKRKWIAKDKSAYQQLKSIYGGQGYNID